MPVEVIRTIKPSGGDYTSLSAWEAAEARDLVTADEIAVAECYKGDYSSTGGGTNFITDKLVFSTNWIVDSTRYVVIRVPQSERHNGVPKDSNGNFTGFTIYQSGAYAVCVDSPPNYSRIYGLCCYTDGGGSQQPFDFGGKDYITVDGLLVSGNGSASNRGLIMAYDSSCILVNCLAINVATSGYTFYSSGYTDNCRLYNCTSIGGGVGFGHNATQNASSSIVYKNCLAHGASTACFEGLSAGTISVDYCASSDATAAGFGGVGNRANQTFTFVDPANDDYHLAATDAGAKDYGTDLSADPVYPFNYDIDGETRTAPWDIGADEHVSGGGSTTYTRTFSAEALIQRQNVLRQASADAMLQVEAQLQAQADSMVALAAALQAQAEALVQGTNSTSASVEALLQKAQALTTGVEALIQKVASVTASADAYLTSGTVAGVREAFADAMLQRLVSITASVDAMVASLTTLGASADAMLSIRQALQAQADALLKATVTKGVSADSLIRAARSAIASADAALAISPALSAVADGVLSLRALLSLSANALLRKVLTKTVGADAYIRTQPGQWGAVPPPSKTWTESPAPSDVWTIIPPPSKTWT